MSIMPVADEPWINGFLWRKVPAPGYSVRESIHWKVLAIHLWENWREAFRDCRRFFVIFFFCGKTEHSTHIPGLDPSRHAELSVMPLQIVPLLMFDGKAEEAMNFYISLFENSAITSIERYGHEGPGAESSVKHAAFTLTGRPFMCIDSPVKHAFSFTPSISLHIDCVSEEEIDTAFARLAEGGASLMPLDRYPFSRKFGWVNDRYGVSWQLNLR
jgi:predicted 3-demethylubiquinone-9 3-methyltransferase (glyoxalase superfamily)